MLCGDALKGSKRIIITLPRYLKGKLEDLAKENDCSQAEILRVALIRMVEAER